jgi:hypothetical protein
MLERTIGRATPPGADALAGSVLLWKKGLGSGLKAEVVAIIVAVRRYCARAECLAVMPCMAKSTEPLKSTERGRSNA